MTHFLSAKFRLRALALAAITLTNAMAADVQASEPPGEVNGDAQQEPVVQPPHETVIVTGVRASLRKAMETKRAAETVVEAIEAKDIADFPDQNIGMALSRLTGVSTTRSNGTLPEGSAVRIRGLPTTFTQSTINGVALVSPNASREADFSLFPSDLFSRVEVNKTAIPDQTEGGLAGTVNLRTLRPLDIPGFKAVATAKAQQSADRGKIDPETTLLLSNTNDAKTLGGLISVASSKYYQRSDFSQGFGFIATPLDTDGNGSKETNALVPQLPRNGVWEYQRKRDALVVAGQARPNENVNLTAEATFAKVVEDQYRRTIDGFPLINGANNVATPKSLNIAEGLVTKGVFPNVDQRSENLHILTETDLKFYNFDGSVRFDDGWVATGKVAYSVANQTLNSQNYLFKANNTFAFDLTGDPHYVKFGNPDNLGMQTDMTQFVANQFRFTKSLGSDKEPTVRFDLAKQLGDGIISRVKVGAQWSHRTKEFAGFDGRGLPAQYAGMTLDKVGQLLPYRGVLSDAPAGSPKNWGTVDFQRANATFDNSLVPVPQIWANTFRVEEKVKAGYIRSDLDTELAGRELTGNFGARVVKTDQTSVGYALVNSVQTPVTISRAYTDVLPSLNLKLELSPTLEVRFAASKTLTRPAPADIAPTQSISNATLGIVTAGNPLLDPFRSRNLDLSLEWYPSSETLVAVSMFDKAVQSFIYNQTSSAIYHGPLITDTGPLEGKQVTVNSRVNGQGGYARGLEVGFQQPFKDLGGLFSNFGIAANASYARTYAPLQLSTGVTRDSELPGAAKLTFNFIPYYEANGLSIRLAYSTRSRVLNGVANNQFIYSDSQRFLDLSVKYAVNKNLSLSVEGANLTGQGDYQYANVKSQNQLYSTSKRTYKFGARYQF